MGGQGRRGLGRDLRCGLWAICLLGRSRRFALGPCRPACGCALAWVILLLYRVSSLPPAELGGRGHSAHFSWMQWGRVGQDVMGMRAALARRADVWRTSSTGTRVWNI